MFRPFGRFLFFLLLAAAFSGQSHILRGQAIEQSGAVAADEAAKRLQWLKTRVGSNAEPQATPQPTPAVARKRFAGTRAPELRPLDVRPVDTGTPKDHPTENPIADTHPKATPSIDANTPAPRIADTHAADTHPKATPGTDAHTPAPRIADTHTADTHPKTTPGTDAHTPVPRIADTHTADTHPKATPGADAHTPVSRIADTHTADTHPKATPGADGHTPAPRIADTHTADTHPKATPGADAHTPTPRIADTHPPDAHPKLAHPAATPVADAHAADKHPPVAHHTEVAATDVRIVNVHPAETPAPSYRLSNTRPSVVANRYPWKIGIVTTIFWIGEPTGGNNFTPNYSSSWDSNWTRAYGGYDNPNPGARHNFIPVNFIPQQNPFYVALPYNDVTRGTTKPEARVVIPWFKEAFRKEGQSVCRDRWVAIRNRAGRVGYAQWSDCGPFRTDHWQYVFGMERPKPNLNQGAGLDVSPAMRDYLGLQSTDVTDWKFVDARDVPIGPWSLYGGNNTFAQRGSR